MNWDKYDKSKLVPIKLVVTEKMLKTIEDTDKYWKSIKLKMMVSELIKEKAYLFPIKTKEDRVRRGAYIDAMIIAKENRIIDIKEFVDFVISKNSELINDFYLIDLLNEFKLNQKRDEKI